MSAPEEPELSFEERQRRQFFRAHDRGSGRAESPAPKRPEADSPEPKEEAQPETFEERQRRSYLRAHDRGSGREVPSSPSSSTDTSGDQTSAERPAPPGTPRLVVVIPALNEEASLGLVLQGIATAQTDPAPIAVFVGDNGSTDATPEVARAHGAIVIHQPRRGYGSACLAALAAARNLPGGPPDAVCFVDADFSDYPEDMPAIVGPVLRGEADLVIGSRTLLPESRQALLPQARFGNRLATGLIRLLWGASYTDLGPFRAVSWAALEQVDMRDPDFGWTVELQVKAARLGLRHLEVPVRYRERVGVSKITGTLVGSYRAGTTILRTIGRFALADRLRFDP